MLNPLHTSMALGPLAVYFILLGSINLARRPFITTGARDLYVLGIALSGFAIIGPLDLFMPSPAMLRFGGLIWVFLIALYSLCLTLLVLVAPPRLVIYNLTSEQLQPLLENLIGRLQLEHRWAGDCLALPGLGVQLRLNRFSVMRNTSLVSTSAQQSFFGWRCLETELAAALRDVKVERNPVGGAMMTIGIAVLASNLAWVVVERNAVAQGLLEMLRL